MAKRFTDTGIWDKGWFRKLTPTMKEAWRFLCDKCNHAGIWDIDMETMSHFINENVSVDDLGLAFGGRIQFLAEEKIFIPGFIEFQYSCSIDSLNPNNKVHLSVLNLLRKYGVCKPLASPSQGAKDKDKDKEQDKDKEKESAFSSAELKKLWDENRGPLPEVREFSEERKSKARTQLAKYPDPNHWLDVISRWKRSEFCLAEWRPGFDDLLSEKKRIRTLEGKYDNRKQAQGGGFLDAV